MNENRLNFLWKAISRLILVLFVLLLMPCLLFAQKYPTKPINLIVSSASAGSHDTSTRMLATPAEKLLGQPFVVVNKAEGAGSVGLGILAKARADGYYIGSAQSFSFTHLPQLRSVTYKLEDFVPVISFARIPMCIAVRTDSGLKTFKEFIEYAKKNPGKVTYSLSGVSSAYYIGMEYIRHKEGIDWAAMPYPGGSPYVPLLGKHVQATASGPTVLPDVKSGELRVLAVMNAKRWKALPDVPTLRELGYDFSEEILFSIIAPNGTPPAIVSKLHDTFQAVTKDPGFIGYIEKMGMEVAYMNSADSLKFLRQSRENFARLMKVLNIPTEQSTK
jgi:tripartite-type tricarboxylate transporter receptor subunit TctC